MAKGIAKIQFISDGFRDILQTEGTQTVVQEVTESIKQNCVANFAAVSLDGVDADAAFNTEVKQATASQYRGRYVGFVSTSDPYAVAAETEDKIMTRALS